jgi:hypothetical protein
LAAERLHCHFDHAHDARFVRNVNLCGHGRTDFAGHEVGRDPVYVGENHGRTFARHQPRGSLADATASARDDCNLALEASHRSRLCYAGLPGESA